jgi:GT2 family glycosyltransferase
MNRIAVLIPVHNNLQHTIGCLKELEHHKNRLFFLKNKVFTILIDDGSTDGTSDWTKDNYPEVIILHGDGSLWWSGGMNLGVKYALEKLDCNFILLWENDISPVDSYFDSLQDLLDKRGDNDIICSKIYYLSHPTVIFAMGGFFNRKTGHKSLHGRLAEDNEDFSKILNVDWFCGQGNLIPKRVFDMIGFFDEKNFPQYHGDSDFALRAKYAGFNNLIYPELKLWNDVSTTGITHVHNKSFRLFFKTLTSLRSNNNIKKDILFYNRHATSIFAFKELIHKYFIYSGSFIKWKVLGWMGVKKEQSELY